MATAPTEIRIPFLQQGYKLVFKKPCLAYKETAGYAQVPNRPIYIKIGNGSDKRGKPPAGTTPTSSLRYSMYIESSASDTGTSNIADLSATAMVATRGYFPIPIVGVTFQRSSVVFCNTFFEGSDFIDVPVSSLTKTDKGIKVPTTIFRVVHAGVEKLIPEKTDKDLSYWMTIGPYLSTNLAGGTTLTDDAPFDIKQLFKAGTSNVDTASDTIKVSGSPEYVSYVGITKPLFRDVIMTSASTSTDGFAINGSYTQVTNPTPISSAQAKVLRFAWVSVGTEKEPRYQWRLAETFGVPPALIPVVEPPPGLSEKNDPTDVKDHYVYDLNETTYPDWQGFYPSLRILKKGYSVAYAKAKMDTESVFYDAEFSAKILNQNAIAEVVTGTGDQKSVLVSNAVDFYPDSATTLLTGYGAVCGVPATVGGLRGTSINRQTYVYTSPRFVMAFGSNSRMGTEYHCTLNGSTPIESADAAFLVRTLAAPSVCSTYDACLESSSIFTIAAMGDYTSIVERSVDDSRWAFSNIPKAPESQSSHFIIGEYPYRSEGSLVFLPELPSLEAETADGKFSIPGGKIPVMVVLKVVEDGDTEGTFKLYQSAGQQGTPSYELSLGELSASASGTINIIIPTKTYGSYAAGGGIESVEDVKGCSPGTVIASVLEPYTEGTFPDDMSKYSDAQVSKISELQFPVKANSVSATTDCVSGYSIMAYEIEGHINLGFRSSHFGPFVSIRDVILRVPNDETDGTSLPIATKPVLMSDMNTRSMLLFYIYKDRLLAKRIPQEVLEDLIGSTPSFAADPEKEALAIKQMHMLTSSVIYASIDDTALSGDMSAGAIRSIVDLEVPVTLGAINEYCVFTDQIGYIYSVVQTDKQLYVFRSYNGGDSWENLLPDGFSFYPPKGENPSETEKLVDAATPQRPFVLVDWPSQTGHFFYFVEDNILLFNFPVEVLRESKDALAEELSLFIHPKVVVGQLTADMAERGITYGNQELSNKNPPIKATPQKVSGVITKNGAYRVFFKDNNDVLRSIVSFNMGNVWLLDEDIKES